MNRALKRFIGVTAASVGLTCVITVFHAAVPDIAKAGGMGDFYWKSGCSPVNRSYLQGHLSNYDIHNFADQGYHHGTNGSLVGTWKLVHVLYKDESWPITTNEIWDALGFSGTMQDGTQYFDVKSTVYTVKFIWSNGKTSATCSLRH